MEKGCQEFHTIVSSIIQLSLTDRCHVIFTNHGPRKSLAKGISARWFSVTMGTGIVSNLLHNLPYNATWLYWLSVFIFALNVLLFSIFSLLSILRYTLYPKIWFIMIRHPVQSLFLGTFPIGLATIINMTVFVCVPVWGTWAIYLVSIESSCCQAILN